MVRAKMVTILSLLCRCSKLTRSRKNYQKQVPPPRILTCGQFPNDRASQEYVQSLGNLAFRDLVEFLAHVFTFALVGVGIVRITRAFETDGEDIIEKSRRRLLCFRYGGAGLGQEWSASVAVLDPRCCCVPTSIVLPARTKIPIF